MYSLVEAGVEYSAKQSTGVVVRTDYATGYKHPAQGGKQDQLLKPSQPRDICTRIGDSRSEYKGKDRGK